MSLSFSRSLRSLQSDNGRLALVGLVIAIVFLCAWAAWFVLARITLYETGQVVDVTRDGTVVADFPLDALGRVGRGQPALLRPQGAIADQVGAIPAIVISAEKKDGQDQVQVLLYPQPDASNVSAWQEGLVGRVEVEVEQVSPAALVLRASGQFLDTPSLSLSPQER